MRHHRPFKRRPGRFRQSPDRHNPSTGRRVGFEPLESRLLLAIDAAEVGILRGGRWYLDATGNEQWDGTAGGDLTSIFGSGGDQAASGDFNADGVREPGVFRGGRWYLDTNGSGAWEGTAAGDTALVFGSPADVGVVGDWDGDGTDSVGIYRNGRWYLDANGNGTWDGTAGGDLTSRFGSTNDRPVVGDWDGDGTDEIGIYRNGQWYLDGNGNGTWNGTAAGDLSGHFGGPTDQPVTGDWDNDGHDQIGVFRNGTWYQDTDGNVNWSPTDHTFGFGTTGDQPAVGRWRSPLKAASARPGELIEFVDPGGFNPARELFMRFVGPDYTVDVPVLDADTDHVVAPAPLLFDSTLGEFTTDVVDVSVVDKTGGGDTVVSEVVKALRVRNLPESPHPAGAVTAAFLGGSIDAANQLLQDVQGTDLDTPGINDGLNTQIAEFTDLLSDVQDVTNNPANSFSLGSVGGVPLTVGSGELHDVDRGILAMLMEAASDDVPLPSSASALGANSSLVSTNVTCGGNEAQQALGDPTSRPVIEAYMEAPKNNILCHFPDAAVTALKVVGASAGIYMAVFGTVPLATAGLLSVTLILSAGMIGNGGILVNDSPDARSFVQTGAKLMNDAFKTLIGQFNPVPTNPLLSFFQNLTDYLDTLEQPDFGGPGGGTPASITVSPTSGLTTSEDGDMGTFEVVLDVAPSSNVTMNVVSSNTDEGTVDKSSLTFTPSNWFFPQVVTVTGQEDNPAVDDGDQPYTINIGPAVSGDSRYNGIGVSSVSVTNEDNDDAAMVFQGSGSGSQTATVPDTPCVYQHVISGTMTVTLLGNGTPGDPYRGNTEATGNDVATLVSGPSFCEGIGVGGGFFTDAPISSIGSTITSTGVGNGFTVDFTGVVNPSMTAISGTALVDIPAAGVFGLAISTTLTKLSPLPPLHAAATDIALTPASTASAQAPSTPAVDVLLARATRTDWSAPQIDTGWSHPTDRLQAAGPCDDPQEVAAM